MRLLSIRTVNRIHSFSINHIKNLIGETNEKYNIFNSIKAFFNKISCSEYGKENNNNIEVLIDGKQVLAKTAYLLNFNSTFDLLNEYKLTQKSIFYFLLETFIKKIEFNEHFQTINILLKDLLNEIELGFRDNGIPLSLMNFEINCKSLLSNISLSLIKEEMLTNQTDYSIEELVHIKERICHFLIKNNKQIQFIIIDENSLINFSEFVVYDNVLLLTTNKKAEELSDIYNYDTRIDYGNDESLYELFMNSNFSCDYDMFKTELLKRII